MTSQIDTALGQLARGVANREPRLTAAALAAVPAIRRTLTATALRAALAVHYTADSTQQRLLLNALPPASADAAMQLDVPADAAPAKPATPETPGADLPEGHVFMGLLTLLHLLDSKHYAQGIALASELIASIVALNRRTMDQLASKIYFYWVRLHEVNGNDTGPLRATLLAAQRTAALRRDDDLQATLLPLLLRNYLEHHLYDQADRLVSKTTFPQGTAGNAQLARWYYYVGRIRAIQLNYTEAQQNLQQAIRRAPDARRAPGFVQIARSSSVLGLLTPLQANKLAIIVELLMGDIPERSTFRQPVLKNALVPYLEIVQAVRVGDLTKFNLALTTHAATFAKDHNSSLVLRLRHNVIKTALRTISLAYSKISLRDVMVKLHLDSEEDAEYIVAKAIRDGVIIATVDHEKGYMMSREVGDVYATNEPMEAFDTRIKFLLELHQKSVKSMRYPLNVHAKELATAGEARERERELAKEIEDAGDDADLDADDMEGF